MQRGQNRRRNSVSEKVSSLLPHLQIGLAGYSGLPLIVYFLQNLALALGEKLA